MFKLLGSKLRREGNHDPMSAYCSESVIGIIVVIIWTGENRTVNNFAKTGMQHTLPSFLIALVTAQALVQRWARAMPQLKQEDTELT